MTIPIHKLICGNCGLRLDSKCTVKGDVVDPLRLACAHLYNDFEDKGFALEKTQEIDLVPILAEIEVLMRGERELDRQFIIEQKRRGSDGTNLMGCYWYQFWDNEKKIWKVPSLAWVREKGVER